MKYRCRLFPFFDTFIWSGEAGKTKLIVKAEKYYSLAQKYAIIFGPEELKLLLIHIYVYIINSNISTGDLSETDQKNKAG